MKYFIRKVRLMKVTNGKRYPLHRLAICYDGHDFEPLTFDGLYCGYTAEECRDKFNWCLYKYTNNYFETNNIVSIKNKMEFNYRRKYKDDSIPVGVSYVVLHEEEDPLSWDTDKTTIEYKHGREKEETTTGLYTYDELTKEYIYVKDSFYHNNMYYVLE